MTYDDGYGNDYEQLEEGLNALTRRFIKSMKTIDAALKEIQDRVDENSNGVDRNNLEILDLDIDVEELQERVFGKLTITDTTEEE